jgi:D-alanine-D-alanine ligase-like ATP-grasp enzyme
VLKASVPKFMRKHGYFDLLGLDFMVSDDNKLVLLEVNTNPAMSLGMHVRRVG